MNPRLAAEIARQDAARTRRILQASRVPTKAIWFDMTGEIVRGVTWTRIEYRIAAAVRAELMREAAPAQRAA